MGLGTGGLSGWALGSCPKLSVLWPLGSTCSLLSSSRAFWTSWMKRERSSYPTTMPVPPGISSTTCWSLSTVVNVSSFPNLNSKVSLSIPSITSRSFTWGLERGRKVSFSLWKQSFFLKMLTGKQATREVKGSVKGCESNKTTCNQAWRSGKAPWRKWHLY